MNTVFFDKAADLSQNFSWKDIFSDVFKPHSKEQRSALLTKGIGQNVPAPSRMLKEWQKPWLFFWVGIVGLVLSVISILSWKIFAGWGMGIVMFILPAFVMPLTALIFYWEMDISGNTSIFDTLLMMIVGGILALAVTGIVHRIIPLPETLAYISGPLPEEIAKFIIVWLLLSRSKNNYGLQGIVIGGAVGVGFSAIESAGYAWSNYDAMFYNEEIQDAAMRLQLATEATTQSLLIRGALAIGGHVVWAALYGGALGLLKGKGKMQFKFLGDPLVLMTFTGAFLLHTFWNLSCVDFVGVLPDGMVMAMYRVESLYIKHILLIILGWMFLLFIMRKCIRQAVAVSEFYTSSAAVMPQPKVQGGVHTDGVAKTLLTVSATGKLNSGKMYKLTQGSSLVFGRDPARANVRVPSDTKGISAVHCEIKVKEGFLVLIDRNSTYGTFFSNGQKLEPNVPYKLKDNVKFYLAAQDNQFVVHLENHH